jgi:rare lipoprotein A
MKKILLLPVILVLSNCSTNQIKTGEAPNQTPLIYQSASIPKVNLTLPNEVKSEKRHHSIIEIGKGFFGDEKQKENSTGDVSAKAENESLIPRIARYIKKGIASWYGPGFHGKKTATGEIFDMYEMTAAHKTLPIPSYAEVTNLKNNRTVIVRVNDRGPYVGNRVLDLSYAAAKKLGIQGIGKVEVKAITPLQALPHIQKTAASQNKNVYFQVGSFGSQTKALKLQDKMAFNNLPEPTIRATKNRKKTQYKVQVGPLKSPENAEMLSYQLAKMGIKDPEIVTASRQN